MRYVSVVPINCNKKVKFALCQKEPALDVIYRGENVQTNVKESHGVDLWGQLVNLGSKVTHLINDNGKPSYSTYPEVKDKKNLLIECG